MLSKTSQREKNSARYHLHIEFKQIKFIQAVEKWFLGACVEGEIGRGWYTGTEINQSKKLVLFRKRATAWPK